VAARSQAGASAAARGGCSGCCWARLGAVARAIFVQTGGLVRYHPEAVERRADSPERHGSDWLARFHAGDRAVMEEIYRDHFDAVHQAAGRFLDGANRETVVHEVFLRLLSNAEMRRSFDGGSIGGWLRTVTRNQAIDFRRRLSREVGEPDGLVEQAAPQPITERVEAKMLIDRFRREVLPAKWAGVFEARFLGELDQREAARSLGISRTTLAYQELRIRSLLRAFLLGAEDAA
jgi:RNA polymerase sigma-70 factor (ECF subfamily)